MVTITTSAAEKLGGILEQKGLKTTHGLRVFVKGGGCGGMQYGMTFEDTTREGDEVFEQHGMRVFVDPTSSFYINGANIDYIDNLMGGGFHIDNPNATSSCGCGSSFRTAQSHTGEEMPKSCSH
ncbi:MAG: iron-sulfur cluster assembly accessory protein [Caldilineaceae bacterium]|nr:iron-sulfur cluster assembly accessory protein [Caldilineaceae bacterium]